MQVIVTRPILILRFPLFSLCGVSINHHLPRPVLLFAVKRWYSAHGTVDDKIVRLPQPLESNWTMSHTLRILKLFLRVVIAKSRAVGR